MRHGTPIAMAVVLLLLSGAVAVRAIEPSAPAAPVEEDDALPILQPMQLLRAGGEERMAELDPFVALDRRVAFVDARLDLLEVRECPPLHEWLRSRRGLALVWMERLVARIGLRLPSALVQAPLLELGIAFSCLFGEAAAPWTLCVVAASTRL